MELQNGGLVSSDDFPFAKGIKLFQGIYMLGFGGVISKSLQRLVIGWVSRKISRQSEVSRIPFVVFGGTKTHNEVHPETSDKNHKSGTLFSINI